MSLLHAPPAADGGTRRPQKCRSRAFAQAPTGRVTRQAGRRNPTADHKTGLRLRHVSKHPDPPQFEPPATEDEVHAAALQYVRKISGATKPSAANAEAFQRAVEAVAEASAQLLDELVSDGAAEGP